MKKATIYIVTVKGSKIPFRITPRKATVDNITATYPDKDFDVQKKAMEDWRLSNLLIEFPWSFDKEEFRNLY